MIPSVFCGQRDYSIRADSERTTEAMRHACVSPFHAGQNRLPPNCAQETEFFEDSGLRLRGSTMRWANLKLQTDCSDSLRYQEMALI
jgi:hypothetical protein